MQDETAKENRQTKAWISHDVTQNNEWLFLKYTFVYFPIKAIGKKKPEKKIKFINKLTSLPTCDFIAQVVEHRTGIVEVTGSNPVEALIFFSGFFFPIV